MTFRTMLLAVAAVTAAGCSPRRIPGTEIKDTRDARAVFDVVQSYRQAMEKRDPAAVLALVAPNYFDTAGTPEPDDDLDRGRLEASLAQDLSRAEGVKLDFTVRKIEVTGDDAIAELFFDSYYRVQTASGAIPRRDSDVYRLRLHRLDGGWKIVSGL
jgi:SnoaL-like domain